MPLIDWDRLELSPHRPEGHVARPSAALTERLRKFGVVDQPVVYPLPGGRYEVLTHSETVVACGRLQIDHIPCTVRNDLDDEEAAAIAHDFACLPPEEDPVTYAEAIASRIGRVPRHGAVSRLAREMGVSRSKIAHSMRLLSLPSSVLDKVRAGEIKVGHAKAILTAPLSSQQIELAQRVVDQSLTVSDTQKMATSIASGDTPPTPVSDTAFHHDPDIRRLENAVSDMLACTFRIEPQGRAVINYYGNLDILDGVLERMGYSGD